MLRSVIAIVTGFVVIAVLSFTGDAVMRSVVPSAFGEGGRVDNTAILLVMQVYVAVFAILGCWLAARLAPGSPMRHALILGALGLVFNVVGAIALWNTAPTWYHLLSIALVMPYAWIGGRLREAGIERGAAGVRAA